MELMFEGKIDAACSFLIKHDMLKNGIVLLGKIGMQKALDEGVLVLAYKADSVMHSQNQKIDRETVNDLDQFADDVDASDFIDNVEFKNPSNFELMIRRVLSPLAQVYIFTVLKFRKFKSWFIKKWSGRKALYVLLIGGNSNDQNHGLQQ